MSATTLSKRIQFRIDVFFFHRAFERASLNIVSTSLSSGRRGLGTGGNRAI